MRNLKSGIVLRRIVLGKGSDLSQKIRVRISFGRHLAIIHWINVYNYYMRMKRGYSTLQKS